MALIHEKPPLDELAHFGVKGMKWGVRRGSLGDRARAATTQYNKRNTEFLTRIKNNKPKGVIERIQTKTLNKQMVAKDLERLKEQRKRIQAGKLKVNDYLDGALGSQIMPFFDYVVDTDKK